MGIYERDGAGTDELEIKEQPLYGSGQIAFLNKSNDKVVYQLSDYLGNVRVLFSWNSSSSELDIESWADYYPFGEKLPGRNSTGSDGFRMGYQGQEKAEGQNWLNFQLRMYNPSIGRFLTTDPMSQFHSPYLAMANNPISAVDPSGGWAYWAPHERAKEKERVYKILWKRYFGEDNVMETSLGGSRYMRYRIDKSSDMYRDLMEWKTGMKYVLVADFGGKSHESAHWNSYRNQYEVPKSYSQGFTHSGYSNYRYEAVIPEDRSYMYTEGFVSNGGIYRDVLGEYINAIGVNQFNSGDNLAEVAEVKSEIAPGSKIGLSLDEKDEFFQDEQKEEKTEFTEIQIINETDHSIYIKPEDDYTIDGVKYSDKDAIEVKPGESSVIPVDGVNVGGKVYKITDGYNTIIIKNNGDIETNYTNFVDYLYYRIAGGRLYEEPNKNVGDWKELFESITP